MRRNVFREMFNGLDTTARRGSSSRRGLCGLTCRGGLTSVQGVRLHAVQVLTDLRAKGTDVLLENGARGVGEALLKIIYELALCEDVSATAGEGVEAFVEKNLRFSWLYFGVQHRLVFVAERFVRQKA